MECLFNTHSENVAAYCIHHRCSMTVRQMRTKECLRKQCRHLQKNEQHQYWKQREVTKTRRKQRKEKLDSYFENLHSSN